jgi:hypothetical protein
MKKLIKIESLVNKTNIPVKASKIRHIGLDGFNLNKDKFILTDVQVAGSRFFIRYFDGKDILGQYVPKSLTFTEITGIKAKAMIKTLDAYTVKHLTESLVARYNTIGSDPEIFVEDAKGVVIPAFKFLGSKKKPNKALGPQPANNIYWDGFQAEFDTYGAQCLGWHKDSVQQGLKGLYDLAIKHNPKASLSVKSTLEIPAKMLKEADDEHVEFGCMPSFNIYGMSGLKLPGREVNIRSAGGHIHFGCGKLEDDRLERIIKALDMVLGVASVSLFEGYEDPRRRTMYGLAGEYRVPKHGLEYRVLSNTWLLHPVIMNLVFDLARGAFAFGDCDMLRFWKANEADVIEVINNCDVKGARKMLKKNATILKQILSHKYYGPTVNRAFNMIMQGVKKHIPEANDIKGNWNLNTEWIAHTEPREKNMRNFVSKKSA